MPLTFVSNELSNHDTKKHAAELGFRRRLSNSLATIRARPKKRMGSHLKLLREARKAAETLNHPIRETELKRGDS